MLNCVKEIWNFICISYNLAGDAEMAQVVESLNHKDLFIIHSRYHVCYRIDIHRNSPELRFLRPHSKYIACLLTDTYVTSL